MEKYITLEQAERMFRTALQYTKQLVEQNTGGEGNSPIVEISKSDFESLSTEEKNNGTTYFIKEEN